MQQTLEKCQKDPFLQQCQSRVNEAIFTGLITIVFIFLTLGYFLPNAVGFIILLMFIPLAGGVIRIYGVILGNEMLKLLSEYYALAILPMSLMIVPLLVSSAFYPKEVPLNIITIPSLSFLEMVFGVSVAIGVVIVVYLTIWLLRRYKKEIAGH